MHEHHTLAMIEAKLSETGDKSSVKRIIVGRNEVHDADHFIEEAKKLLAEKFPEVHAEIEVRDPKMFCPECGHQTHEMIEDCPECPAKLKLETNKGVRIE